jgi:hypothetical protein
MNQDFTVNDRLYDDLDLNEEEDAYGPNREEISADRKCAQSNTESGPDADKPVSLIEELPKLSIVTES